MTNHFEDDFDLNQQDYTLQRRDSEAGGQRDPIDESVPADSVEISIEEQPKQESVLDHLGCVKTLTMEMLAALPSPYDEIRTVDKEKLIRTWNIVFQSPEIEARYRDAYAAFIKVLDESTAEDGRTEWNDDDLDRALPAYYDLNDEIEMDFDEDQEWDVGPDDLQGLFEIEEVIKSQRKL